MRTSRKDKVDQLANCIVSIFSENRHFLSNSFNARDIFEEVDWSQFQYEDVSNSTKFKLINEALKHLLSSKETGLIRFGKRPWFSHQFSYPLPAKLKGEVKEALVRELTHWVKKNLKAEDCDSLESNLHAALRRAFIDSEPGDESLVFNFLYLPADLRKAYVERIAKELTEV